MAAKEGVSECESESWRSDLLSATIRVPFGSKAKAVIAYNSLRVDKEPIRGNGTKSLEVEGTCLVVRLEAKEAKHLRVATNSFMELLLLVVRTIARFGDTDLSQKETEGQAESGERTVD